MQASAAPSMHDFQVRRSVQRVTRLSALLASLHILTSAPAAVHKMHSPYYGTHNLRPRDASYSSTALPRRRPLPGGNFDVPAMKNNTAAAGVWGPPDVRMMTPMAATAAAYPQTMPFTTDAKQLHSATSTSGDESSGDDGKAPPKRPKTQRNDKRRAEPKDATKPQRKERKPTHTLRKEQKMELLTQIEQLQGQLESLKSQAIVSNALHVKKHTQAPVMNVILREAVQSRQSTLAVVQGLMSGYVQQQHDISPINTFIKLGLDRAQRHRELVAMKRDKLQVTHEFLVRRSRGLEPGRQYCEEERFETSRGDYCALRFAVSHFRGAASVRAVFDAALVQIANVEMVMSDVLGNITIREDDDNGDDNVTQLRLVTSTGAAPEAPPLETNSLQFNEFREATSSVGPHGAATSEFGIIMADFVDEDELYPYKSQERMRKDVTAALLLTRLPKEEQHHGRVGEENELVVKVTLWSLIKLHHSRLHVSYDCLEETRHEIGRWGEELVRGMQRTLSLRRTH